MLDLLSGTLIYLSPLLIGPRGEASWCAFVGCCNASGVG